MPKERITLYISYSKDGKQFIPPQGSKYVLSIEVSLDEIEAMGMETDDFVRMIVSGRLRTHQISTSGLTINWNTIPNEAVTIH